MFPQGHSDLDQMLHHQLPYAPVPSVPNYSMERSLASSTARWKPNIEVAPNCPRCASTNTKFCYYNNYSLSQPRYFCKGCRRYWTKGGSLRNVPVGGGCRKNRRGKRQSPQTDHRLSVPNYDDGDSSNSAGDQAGEASGSRDIDMAVVFAKYLNQNPGCGTNEDLFESRGYNSNNNNNDDDDDDDNGSSSSNNNLSSSLTTTPESGETENDAVMQPQKDGAVGLLGGAHLEGFGGEDLVSLSGIDELDGFDHDLVWSQHHHGGGDAIAASWQPPPPLMQEMDEYSVAAPPAFNGGELLLPIGSSCVDLMSDGWGATNWSSFDLSAVEVFSSIP